MLKSHYLFLWFTFLVGGQAAAADYSQLETRIADFITQRADVSPDQRLSVSVGQIDPRSGLSPCPNALELSLPGQTVRRTNTVKVVCRNARPWQIYVPVRVAWEQSILVASTPLAPGQTVSRDNSELAWVDSVQLRGGTFTDHTEIAGARSKRRIQQGQPISSYNVCLICKGDNITIIAKSGRLEIKSTGEALEDANAGESVRLRNTRTRKVVVATVVRADVAEVTF